MKIVEIKTLNMIAPLGIDTKPYFSWKMESDQQGTMQEAYQIRLKQRKMRRLLEYRKGGIGTVNFCVVSG